MRTSYHFKTYMQVDYLFPISLLRMISFEWAFRSHLLKRYYLDDHKTVYFMAKLIHYCRCINWYWFIGNVNAHGNKLALYYEKTFPETNVRIVSKANYCSLSLSWMPYYKYMDKMHLKAYLSHTLGRLDSLQSLPNKVR